MLLTVRYMSANTASTVDDEADPETTSVDGLRERILEIAIHRFASQGYSETSTRELVEAARCTKPAMYYYFKSKADLFRSAVELAHCRVDGGDDPELQQLGLRDALLKSLTRLAERLADKPDDLRLLLRADGYTALGSDLIDTRSLRAAHIAMADDLLRRAIETGEVRTDLPVEDAAIALIGMVHLQLELVLDGRPLSDNFAERIVSIYMDGVAR